MQTKPFRITYYQHNETTLLISTIINAKNKNEALYQLIMILKRSSALYKIINIEEVKICY